MRVETEKGRDRGRESGGGRDRDREKKSRIENMWRERDGGAWEEK